MRLLKYLVIKSIVAAPCFIVLFAVSKTYASCPNENPSEESCFAPSASAPDEKHHRLRKYLLYDVNPGEGFNLRRDVYMRVARLVAALRMGPDHEDWVLVLPPWGPLYHWRSKGLGPQMKIKWKEFFDTNSLGGFVPVMEFEDFHHAVGPTIDKVFYLQHYPSTFSSTTWDEKFEEGPCLEETPYYEEEGGTFKLHIRRSMRFASSLRDVADKFRQDVLNSDDERDDTVLEEDWKIIPNRTRYALGGPYLAVHLRRQDYVNSRPKDVPDLKWAAEQIHTLLQKRGLKKVFVATDAGDDEFKTLKTYLPEAVRFEPSNEVRKQLKDGGLAIVDQWIAAHARFFVGSYESTFSFRIQEEREIMNFDPDTTFNRLCGNGQKTCTQPTRWRVAYTD
ncbi:hypothetical protein V5799_028485 [Amblyomma americanum]|uniref:GDP-fucose protein O-fucosyltransferase 2 n=1 Tax=Amblyomma americanum TaxID=6943 RepID=A0AAQ4DCQ7_AMBAM